VVRKRGEFVVIGTWVRYLKGKISELQILRWGTGVAKKAGNGLMAYLRLFLGAASTGGRGGKCGKVRGTMENGGGARYFLGYSFTREGFGWGNIWGDGGVKCKGDEKERVFFAGIPSRGP